MMINASNSGANAFMADFEDSLSDLDHCGRGHVNLVRV
jgi:malate synthase